VACARKDRSVAEQSQTGEKTNFGASGREQRTGGEPGGSTVVTRWPRHLGSQSTGDARILKDEKSEKWHYYDLTQRAQNRKREIAGRRDDRGREAGGWGTRKNVERKQAGKAEGGGGTVHGRQNKPI